MIRIDFHTHTYFSYDSVMKPEKILKRAKAKGLTHIVINDHNTIKGGQECLALAKTYGIEVIVGSEIKTDIGDVTGIFLKEEIEQGPYLEVVRKIKQQGGISILNHPFVGHQLDGLDFQVFDLIEGYNGRCTAEQNGQAIELAQKYGKPIVAGSDAHTYAEIGNNYSTFESIHDLLHPLGHHYQRSHARHKVYSQLIKSGKKKDLSLFVKVLLSAPKKLFFNR